MMEHKLFDNILRFLLGKSPNPDDYVNPQEAEYFGERPVAVTLQ
jgi:hypothetical protein